MIGKTKSFKIGDKVFAKLKGYPAWPARITEVNGKRYNVIFYGTNETATLKPENIVYYLKNKAKYSNVQKRRYFQEAIQDIEEDIKNCGGSDGSPEDEDTTEEFPTQKNSNNKRKRKTLGSDTPNPSIAKRIKVEDQNHNESINDNNEVSDDISSFNNTLSQTTTGSTTSADVDNVLEVKDKSADSPTSESAESKNTLNRLKIANSADSLEESSKFYVRDKSSSENNESLSNTDVKVESTLIAQEDEENVAPNNIADVEPAAISTNYTLKEINVEEVSLLSEIYINALIQYAENVKGISHYYKTIPPDPISLTSSTDTRIKVLPVKLTNDNYMGLIYSERLNGYKSEYDRAIADAKHAEELIGLKAELDVGNHDLKDELIVKLLNCDDAYVSRTLDLPFVEYKQAKVEWLKNELALLEDVMQVKKNLGLNDAKPEVAMQHLKSILDSPIEMISLKKRSQLVHTMAKLCRYVGNVNAWSLGDDEAAEFEKKAAQVRFTANEIYKKIRALFSYGKDDDFLQRFDKECQEFNSFTKHMSSAEVFSLCAEPRSRKAQLELIIDEQTSKKETEGGDNNAV